MIKINEAPVYLNTPKGKGILEDIIITGLGYIQIKVKYQSDMFDECATFTRYNITNIEDLLSNSVLSIVKELNEPEVNA